MSPATVFHARRDDEKPSSGGMIVRQANLPAEVRKPDALPVQTADEVIAEIAAKIAPYKPKPEWEGMSAEEMYERGVEYCPDEPALECAWYRLAAERGHDLAQGHLGLAYRDGVGVSQDKAEAAKWLRLAAEQGLPFAQKALGFMYRDGDGIPQDKAKAADLFCQVGHWWSARARQVEGRRDVWFAYEKRADLWYGYAADLGHRGAAACLAKIV